MVPSFKMRVFICSFLTLVLSGVNGHNYIGCYREGGLESRLMIKANEDFESNLTPELCIEFCKNNGYDYAGLEYGSECYCSSSRPPFYSIANHLDECDKPCRGDAEKKCGGSFRLSVYDIKGLVENPVIANYDGCYEAWTGFKLLSSEEAILSMDLTPERCVGLCYRRGFLYAGLKQGKKCFCGNSKNGIAVSQLLCNVDCTGDKRLKCGGPSTFTVYKTKFINGLSHVHAAYLGCFSDSTEHRAFHVETSFSFTLTPAVCLRHCSRQGYVYAGLQYGSKCFCGDKHYGNKVSDDECDVDCSGDDRLICGGRLRNSVYRIEGAQSARYLGCYTDVSIDGKFLMDLTGEFKHNLTPEKCIDTCKKKDNEYAVLESGSKCRCSNIRPRVTALASHQDECNLPCVGHDEKSCGGKNRFSVYDIKNRALNHVNGKYIGCFETRDGQRVLNSLVTTFNSILTPELCVGHCYRQGFLFAGVQDGIECHCGNVKNGHEIAHELCDEECSGDKRLMCGGSTSVTIYFSGLNSMLWSRALLK